jgi:hypothetical protein
MGQEAYTWTPRGDINFRINYEARIRTRDLGLLTALFVTSWKTSAGKLMGGCNLEADHEELVEEPNGAGGQEY